MAPELTTNLTCDFCGAEFEFRGPQLDWPTPACDLCLLQDSSRGRVVRHMPAKHRSERFDSAREVQRRIDWGNYQCWLGMKDAYEQAG